MQAISREAIHRLVVSRPIPDRLADAIVAAPLLPPDKIDSLCSGMKRVRRPGGPRAPELLKLLCGGASNEEIATALGLSPETVKTYVRELIAGAGARNRTHLAALTAYRQGLRNRAPESRTGSGALAPGM